MTVGINQARSAWMTRRKRENRKSMYCFETYCTFSENIGIIITMNCIKEMMLGGMNESGVLEQSQGISRA